jgi:hypothetical protein
MLSLHTLYHLNRLKFTASSLWLLTISRRQSLVQGDFCGVFSNPAPISFVFSSVSTGFLSRSDPVDLTFLTSLWMPVVLGNVIPRNLRRNFLRHFVQEPHFTHDLHKNTLFNSFTNYVHNTTTTSI